MPTGQAAAPATAAKPKRFTQLQKRFIEELCVDWKKAGAARRAGYSAKNAKQAGQDLWRDPRIRAAVAARAEELTMNTAEATARMSQWARAGIEEVFTIEVQEHRPRLLRPVGLIIADLKAEMEFEQELAIRTEALLSAAEAQKKFRKAAARAHQGRQLELMRYEMLLERNPDATAWVNGAPVAREVAQLNLVKALKMEAGGLIKKITPTRFGIGVELHDAKDAADKILKLQGAYAPVKVDHTTNGNDLPGSNIMMPDNGR